MSLARPAGRTRLSVVILARNAQDHLSPTLESIESLADEIVLVDTGSNDRTGEIGRQFGAKVIERPWIDDFGKMRTNARSHATGEWILWLDAGERLTREGAASLRAFLDTEADRAKAYMLLVVVPPAPGAIAGEQVGRIRLVPNRADLRFEGRVREQIRPSIETAGLTIEGLPWRILRGTREHDPQVKIERAQRDLKLVEQEIQDYGQQPRSLVTLGEALTNLGDSQGAASCFRTAIRHSLPGSIVMREAYYGLLAALDYRDDARDDQIALCVEALEIYPLDAQLLCAMGGYMQAKEQFDFAARAYETAFEYGQVDPETWHIADIDDIAAICLGLVLQLRQQHEAALATLQKALTQKPESVRLRRHLIDLHIKHSRRKEALDEFDKLPTDLPMREALRSAIRGACLAAKQNWAPAAAYLQTAYSAGCRDPICLRWLSATLIATGDLTAARPVVEDWLAIEPRSGEAQKYAEQVAAEATPSRPSIATPGPSTRRIRVDGPATGIASESPLTFMRSDATIRGGSGMGPQ